MTRTLFVRSSFDLATYYLSAYGKLLVDFAIDHGYEVVDLYNDDSQNPARLLRFEAEMEEKKPDILMMLGHGNETVFTGQDLEVLLKVGVNDDIASGVKTNLWGCLAGVSLAPALVSNTTPESYAYTSDWVFLFNPDFEATPLRDPWAKSFFDSALTTGYAMLLGKTPQEVYEATLERYDYWWNWWMKQNDPMADDIMTWLNWNRSSFVAITPDGIYKREKLPVSSDLAKVIIPVAAVSALLFLTR